MAVLNGLAGLETPEFLMSKIDQFGGPEAYNHYAVGWAHAMDTPYQWTKQVASHWGGTRNGTIVHWPNGIKAKGDVRSQFHHVIDVAPTVLEAAGLPHPPIVNSIQQAPIEGISMLYAFNDAKAAERHETQYFEMFCNRGIYHKGWTAVTRHGVPWSALQARLRRGRVGALRHQRRLDPGARSGDGEPEEARRAAASVHHRGALQRPAARRSDVRTVQPRPRRPAAAHQGQHPAAFRRDGTPQRELVLSIKNKSYTITADVEVPKAGAEGVIVAQGGSTNGWSLYAKGGKLKYCYNFFGIDITVVEATREIPGGHHQLRMEFKYDGGGLAKGGAVTLYVDGKSVGQGRVERTVPMAFSADETCDVGKEAGSPVSPDYGPDGNAFSGEVNWVQSIDRTGDPRPHGFARRTLPRRDGAAVVMVATGAAGPASVATLVRTQEADSAACRIGPPARSHAPPRTLAPAQENSAMRRIMFGSASSLF